MQALHHALGGRMLYEMEGWLYGISHPEIYHTLLHYVPMLTPGSFQWYRTEIRAGQALKF